MFECFPVGGTDRERAAKFEAYWGILAELPPAAVIEACRQACRAKLPSAQFLPSVAELYDAANKTRVYPSKRSLPVSETKSISPAKQQLIGRGMSALSVWLKTQSQEALDEMTEVQEELKKQA